DNDLVFYQYFVKQHPDEAVGWLFFGREWEKRGKRRKALEAYRRSLHAKPGEFTEEAREAYHTLLRKREKQPLVTATRRITGLLAFLTPFLFLPGLVGEQPEKLPQYAQPSAARPMIGSQPTGEHVEVLAVPDKMSTAQLQEQVLQYLKSSRPALK
ncbi:hypothetical protein MXD81_09245, partial [Microbacteriaceae bacterium K1510]|nr:hypothetical protein [Frankia sp. Cpl3]MCK9909314.1 hypothetical protein [Microbacteriaceae bacterium K1510]